MKKLFLVILFYLFSQVSSLANERDTRLNQLFNELKANKSKYEIQEMTREDIYYGLETAVHTIKIIENVCKTFDNLDDYYKLIYPAKKWDRSEKLESEVKNQYRNYFGTEAYGGI